MDISGNTVHMVNNVSKTILNQVDSTVEDLCCDIYYDIEESPKVHSIFQEVQGLLNNGHVKHIICPISSRFLQMLDICDRVIVFFFVLRFYGPVNPMGSCRARSVYLTTRLLGRLSPLSG